MHKTTLFFLALVLTGCTRIGAIAAGPTPGEFYVVAQKGFLVFQGVPYVTRCVEDDVALHCERILTGQDVGTLSPSALRDTTFPASALPSTTGGIAPEVEAFMALAYATLGYPQKATDRERDAKALQGMELTTDLTRRLSAARQMIRSSAPLYELIDILDRLK